MFKMTKKKAQAENPKVKESEIKSVTEVVAEVAESEAETEVAENTTHLPKQKTIPELILEYVNNQEGEEVELNEYFISLYSVPESIVASKDIKYCLDAMVKSKQISLANSRYHDLGKTYYDERGIANKHSILDVKILAKK